MEFTKNADGSFTKAADQLPATPAPIQGLPVIFKAARKGIFNAGSSHAAIITKVNDDGTANLVVFHSDTDQHYRVPNVAATGTGNTFKFIGL